MKNLEIIIIVLLSLILLFIIFFTSYFIYKKLNLNKKNDKQIILENKIKECDQKINLYNEKINNLLNTNNPSIKKEFFEELNKKYKKEIDVELQEIKNNANLQAANILIDAMQNIIEPIVQENSTTIIKLDDEQIKGRIIGKEGRNKKSFEMITGTELIIDKDNQFITISSFNPIRREIAKLVLEQLLKAKNIDANKIETLFSETSKKFNKQLCSIGKEVVEDKLKIYDLNKDLYPYIGRMKYRSSFGQNALNHILECTCIAKEIANQLNLDEKLAMKCALLHDIGKSIDYELNTNHIDVGLEIAKKLKLPPEVINAIESHHNNVQANNIYSEITKIADTISASRPGARLNSSNEYFQRIEKLENIIKTFKEVNQTYVLKAGRYIRIIVNPILIKDQALSELGKKIKNAIENDDLTKGYNIKVCLIKENKYEFETENKLI